MRYEYQVKPAFKSIKWVYLEVWTCEEGKLMFAVGNRQDWFKQHARGHIIEGKHASVCCYQSFDCPDEPLTKAMALRASIAYMTGYYKTITVDLADRI